MARQRVTFHSNNTAQKIRLLSTTRFGKIAKYRKHAAFHNLQYLKAYILSVQIYVLLSYNVQIPLPLYVHISTYMHVGTYIGLRRYENTFVCGKCVYACVCVCVCVCVLASERASLSLCMRACM